MKTMIVLIAAASVVWDVLGTSVGVPPLGEMVRSADTIVKGTLSAERDHVLIVIESSIKGKYRPLQTVRITANHADIFFDMSDFALKLKGQSCFVLGTDRSGELHLPWNAFSVWPQGISNEWPLFGDIDNVATLINTIVKYEQLEADPNTLVSSLLSSLQVDRFRPAALAYINSDATPLKKDKSLERDVLSVTAAYISSRGIYDDWTASVMRSLAPSMPQSVTIPYFMEVARRGGKQGDLAHSAVEAALKVRHIIRHDTTNRKSLSDVVKAVLPKLRDADAEGNAHLFDSMNRDIAASASLVFGAIFDESRPDVRSIIEEKGFWMNRISKRKQ